MERDLRGTWKVKNPGIKKTKHPIVGLIYQSHNIVGVCMQLLQEQVVLRTKDGGQVVVSKKDLIFIQ